MAKFVELTRTNGSKVLVNTDYIEAVHAEGYEGRCVVYMAFTCPQATEQDYYTVKESYEDVVQYLYRVTN